MYAIQQDCAHADQALMVNCATVQYRGVTNRDIVTNSRRMRLVHHMNDRAVLHVRSSSDADPMNVSTKHRGHPDPAFLADFDVADHVSAGVDECRGMDAREDAAKRPEHSADYRRVTGLKDGTVTIPVPF